MPETKVKWTAYASYELDKIFNFIAKESQSIKAAQKFTGTIFQRTNQLISAPHSGQIEPYLSQYSVRYIVVGNYKILYKYQNSTVIITDIFHSNRNPSEMITE